MQARGTKLCVDGGSYIVGRPAFCKPCYSGSFTQVRSYAVHYVCILMHACVGGCTMRPGNQGEAAHPSMSKLGK